MCVHVFIQEYMLHKDILINVCYICAFVIIKPRANILCLYVYMCVSDNSGAPIKETWKRGWNRNETIKLSEEIKTS